MDFNLRKPHVGSTAFDLGLRAVGVWGSRVSGFWVSYLRFCGLVFRLYNGE